MFKVKNSIGFFRSFASMAEAHKTAVSSFNANHSSYDKLRPTYQEPIVLALLKDLELTKESRILELAAGTGKFTRKLVESGFDNIEVVEPSKGMLETFAKSFPGIKTHLGSSYEIPLPDRSVDRIVVAQGFHWFSDEQSLREMRRVLKDNGKVGFIWNFDGESESQITRKDTDVEILGAEDRDTTNVRDIARKIFLTHPWNVKVVDYIYSFDVGVPQYRHGNWKKLLHENKYFKPISKELFYFYKLPVRPDDVYKYWETRSYITDLSAEEKDNVSRRVNEILETNVLSSDEILLGNETVLEKYMGCHAVVIDPKENI